MNILVQPYDSAYWICRPDTSWEKDNEDFFPPECITAISYTPILFTRISKPGKVIGEKFACRYFESINYGILLYPENMAKDGQLGFSQANCVDHTSFLPSTMYNKLTMRQGNEFILKKDNAEIFKYSGGNLPMIEKAVSQASALTYLRVGDMVCVELSAPSHLMSREDGNVTIYGSYCDNWLLEFKIIV